MIIVTHLNFFSSYGIDYRRIKYNHQGLQERLDRLNSSGARVMIEKCDTGVEDDIVALLDRIRSNIGPLQIVIHSAGALSDALITKQSEEKFKAVFTSKAFGAWFLHKHTATDNLLAFVMYSSTSALTGNAGQTNYSAANSFLDALAQLRERNNIAGLSIQWPAVDGIGMAAAMEESFKLPRKNYSE